MNFKPQQFARNGAIQCYAPIEKVFPLLCPKREEEWIPGWECETIWSKSGYNEGGAIFRTLKPYGTELYWNTLRYDIENRIVDFLIAAPHLYMFRFIIEVHELGRDNLSIKFNQVFTSVSAEGNALLEDYRAEDFQGRLNSLGEYMNSYIGQGEQPLK